MDTKTNARDKALHDLLVGMKPDGVNHSCPLCASADPEDPNMTTTFTEAEAADMVKAAVAEATKTLSAELDKLKADAANGEVAAAVAEATKEATAKVTDLEAKLDAQALELEAAKKEASDVKAWLEAAAAEETAAAEHAAKVEARKTAVVEAKLVFPEGHVEANAEKWAAWSDEQFADALESWKAVAAVRTDDPPVHRSPLTAAAVGSPAGGGAASNDLHAVFAMRDAGDDTRKVN